MKVRLAQRRRPPHLDDETQFLAAEKGAVRCRFERPDLAEVTVRTIRQRIGKR